MITKCQELIIATRFDKEKLTASSLGVSSESINTNTVANVIVGSSKGIGTTGIPDARVSTCQVTNFAVFGCVTVWVNPTFWYCKIKYITLVHCFSTFKGDRVIRPKPDNQINKNRKTKYFDHYTKTRQPKITI